MKEFVSVGTPKPYSAAAVKKLKRNTWVKYESFGDPHLSPGEKVGFQIGPRHGQSVWLLRPEKSVSVLRNMGNYGDTNSGWLLWPYDPETEGTSLFEAIALYRRIKEDLE